MFRAHVSGLRELDQRLAALGPKLGPAALGLALEDAAAPTIALAEALAPYDPTREKGRHLRQTIKVTSKLKRSQRAFVDPGTVVRFIGPTARHGSLVEFGHRIISSHAKRPTTRAGRRRDARLVLGRAKALPFLRPAWDATRSQVLERFAARAWAIIRATAAGARAAAESGTLDQRAAGSILDATDYQVR